MSVSLPYDINSYVVKSIFSYCTECCVLLQKVILVMAEFFDTSTVHNSCNIYYIYVWVFEYIGISIETIYLMHACGYKKILT